MFTTVGQKLAWLAGVVFVLTAGLSVQAAAPDTATLGTGLESAVLAEDWDRVLQILDGRDDSTLDAVYRFIKGHACLAVNRNNESLCLFLGAAQDDLKSWDAWSAGFAAAHPGDAIAHYFYGDALARLKEWDSAVEAYNKALAIDPKHFLTFNARGVFFAARKDWNRAVSDFGEAAALRPSFADVYANRGAMYIQMQSGASGALRAFSRALEITPDFVLALNGRGAVQVVIGNWEEAEKDLERANNIKGDCLRSLDATVAQNLTALASAESAVIAEVVTQYAGVEPGFSLDRKYDAFSNMSYNDVSYLKGVLDNNMRWNQGYADIAPNRTTMEMGIDIGTDIGGSFKVGGTWNEYDRTISNLTYQQESLDLLNQMYPRIPAQTVGNIGGFFGSRGANYPFTRSDAQGVSTKGVDAIPIDPGDWPISTVYGLLYPVSEGSIISDRRRK